MPFHKIGKYENQVRRCPSCDHDSMKFIPSLDSWMCSVSWCNNRVREAFYQTTLPTAEDMEQDQIQPSFTETREQLYIKSIRPRSNDYEDSVNHNLEPIPKLSSYK